MDVLSNMIDAVRPPGPILDLQVIRPNPVIEIDGAVVCEVDGSPIFHTADAAVAAIDAAVEAGRLLDEAVDDHDALKHFPTGHDLVLDFSGKLRQLPDEVIPMLEAHTGPCALREHCRLRRLGIRAA